MDKIEHKHSIIIIKNSKNEYLQYFDKRWNSYLFLNCKINEKEDIEKIKDKIVEQLKINKSNIEIKFIMDKVHNKFSESAKTYKKYHHYFFYVNINNIPSNILKQEFIIGDEQFKWYSMTELENNDRIMKVNNDIVSFIKEWENKKIEE